MTPPGVTTCRQTYRNRQTDRHIDTEREREIVVPADLTLLLTGVTLSAAGCDAVTPPGVTTRRAVTDDPPTTSPTFPDPGVATVARLLTAPAPDMPWHTSTIQ